MSPQVFGTKRDQFRIRRIQEINGLCAAHLRFPEAICAYLAFDGQKLDKENPKAASGNPWCWQCVTD